MKISRPIGGEAEIGPLYIHSVLTDSGRSSLRLLLAAGLGEKRFLLPEFLCPTIVDVLRDRGTPYSFYPVGSNLEIDWSTINPDNFEVFYLISYFGHRVQAIPPTIRGEKIVVDDDVFLPYVEPRQDCNNWAGFNSYRKTTILADGSVLKATFPLPTNLIESEQAEFVSIKYRAKEQKFHLLENRTADQIPAYIELFDEAEETLNRQHSIHRISTRSLTILFEILRHLEIERQLRISSYSLLRRRLTSSHLPLQPDYPSFFPLVVDDRVRIREALKQQGVFLPSFWPKIDQLDHVLYRTLLAIPLDSRYHLNDLLEVARIISTIQPPSAQIR